MPFGRVPLISRSNYPFLETDLRINETLGFHALALDEHRQAFAPTLWAKAYAKRVHAGAQDPRSGGTALVCGRHADVGGGYADGILAQVPLRWLMQKAQAHGLVFRGTVVIDGDEVQGPIHDLFAEMVGGAYRALKFFRPYYRAIGAAPVVAGMSLPPPSTRPSTPRSLTAAGVIRPTGHRISLPGQDRETSLRFTALSARTMRPSRYPEAALTERAAVHPHRSTLGNNHVVAAVFRAL